MISRGDAARLREQLATLLGEDASNTEILLARLEPISMELGIGLHTALLLLLTRMTFEESDASRHWTAILEHRRRMAEALGRNVGLRVSMLDYFLNVNRQSVRPSLIDVEMREGGDLTRIDPLTGLATERAFRSAVQDETRRARRYRQRASIVLFDLDGFAAVNAAVGERIADRLLKEVGILLRNKVRDIDLAARPGEDELALVLPETDRNGAFLVAERFRREIQAHFSRRETAGGSISLTVSAGIASYPDDATSPEALLECAAQALYRAKASGKNRVHVHHPERRRFVRIDLEPGRFEVEVLAPPGSEPGRARNLSNNGILFSGTEPLQVGERIEIRLVSEGCDPPVVSPVLGGQVVRLEELPAASETTEPADEAGSVVDRYEIGMAFDLDQNDGDDVLVEFFERAQRPVDGSSR